MRSDRSFGRPRRGNRESWSRSERRQLSGILLIGLLLRVAVFFYQQAWSDAWLDRFSRVTDDGIGYWTLANNLLHKGLFSRMSHAPFLPDGLRTPGYPTFLAGIIELFGDHFWPVFLVQLLLGLCIIPLVYVIARSVFSRRVGRIAAFLAAIDPYAIQFGCMLWSDLLFVVVITLCLGLTTKAVRREERGGWGAWLVIGILLGLSVLVRPIAIYLPLLIVPFVGVVHARRGALLSRGALHSMAAVVIGWGAILAPWIARNYVAFGEVGISASGGFNLLYWTAAGATARAEGLTLDDAQRQLMATHYRSVGDWAMEGAMPLIDGDRYGAVALGIIREHPLDAVAAHGVGIVRMFRRVGGEIVSLRGGYEPHLNADGSPEVAHPLGGDISEPQWADRICFVGNLIFLAVLYGAAIVGILRGPGPRLRSRPLWMLLLIHSAYFILTAGNVGGIRLRLPLHPVMEVMAGGGIALVSTSRKRLVTRYLG